jgi:hypothetical protein
VNQLDDSFYDIPANLKTAAVTAQLQQQGSEIVNIGEKEKFYSSYGLKEEKTPQILDFLIIPTQVRTISLLFK